MMTPAPAPQTAAVDKALADKDRLWRRYRTQKKQQYETLFADPVHGTRLRKFGATLNHFGIEDGDQLLEYVTHEAGAWLRTAPHDVRFAAGEMLSERIVRIRQRAGLCEFDDPLPDEPADVRMLCLKELGL